MPTNGKRKGVRKKPPTQGLPMPKLGIKARTAKVYDPEYAATATAVPKPKDVALFDSLLQDISMSVLRDQIQRFRPDFVNSTGDVLGQRFKDIILPQGTRFYRQGTRAVAFAIEVPPSVRTLSFRGDRDSQVCQKTGKWSLALPYLYFMPIFATEGGRNLLSAVCLGCRTEPLSAPDDMLHCINLPNVYHISAVPGRMPADGMVPGLQQMSVCQGYVSTRRDTHFAPGQDSFNKMTQEVLLHYWSSRFTSELSVVYLHMKDKMPDLFGSLDVWQKKTKEDPLFVLNVEYPPAIRLNKLFDDMMKIHDTEGTSVLGRLNQYVGRVHDEVWKDILEDESYQKIRTNLNEAVLSRFTLAMQKFSQSLSHNLSSINNDVMKRHVLLAITIALREAVK